MTTVRRGGTVGEDVFAHMPETFAPTPEFATIHADGVTGIFQGAGLVKVYLSSSQGEVFGRQVTPNKAVPVGEIVLGIQGFVAMAVFFESQVKSFIANGQIKEEEVRQMRSAFANLNAGK